MTAPERADWKSIWLGLWDWEIKDGWLPVMEETRVSQTAVFDRRLTIGPADKDSDDLISTLSAGDWSGGGQIEEMTGADQTRFWWGIFDGRSPGQACLPPLVLSGKATSATGTCYPLGVVNDTEYFCFGTDIAGVDTVSDSAITWYSKESMTNAPVGKSVEFNGALYVPTGTNGYSIITESSTGNPTVALKTGTADPTSAPADVDLPLIAASTPKAVAFCVAEGNKLFALTVTGGIAWSFTGASDAWHWDYNEAEQFFPKLQSGYTPRHLVNFFNREGTPTMFVVHNRGAHIYNRPAKKLEVTPIQYPNHPDTGKGAAVWRAGEDLWIGTGLDTVHYTSANVTIPLSGVSRDAGVPPGYRGSILDLEPELSALYALVGGVEENAVAVSFSDKTTGGSGSGDGEFNALRGTVVDASGNIWVVDSGNSRLQKLNSTLDYVSKFGSNGDGDGELDLPHDVDLDSSGNLWVVDRGNHRVQKFNSSGTYQSQIDGRVSIPGNYAYSSKFGSHGSGNSNFDTPQQIATDSGGNFYIVDIGNDAVKKFTSGGVYSSSVSLFLGSGPGFRGVAVDSSDNTYVGLDTDDPGVGITKRNSANVTQWDKTYATVTDLGFLATDDTYVYATLPSNNAVGKILASNGGFAGTWGGFGTGNGQFSSPQGIATDGTYVYVADSGNNRVQKFTTGGVYVTRWGSSGSGDGQFNNPQGVAISPTTGDVFVVDAGNDRIQQFTNNGVFISSFGAAGTGDGQFTFGSGILVTAAGVVWASDQGASADRVQAFTSGSSSLGPGDGDGEFALPSGIAINRTTGTIYVADTGNNRVQYFTLSGTYTGQWGGGGTGDGQFSMSATGFNGIVVNQTTGDVYVADRNNFRIQQFTSTGTFVRKWGGFGTENGQFSSPVDLTINPDNGNVFVVDSANDVVQEFTSTGSYVGRFGASGSGDGQFGTPHSIAFNDAGDFAYVTDFTASRVQEFAYFQVTNVNNSKPYLVSNTGVGWQGLWEGTAGDIPTWAEVMQVTDGYRLWWGLDDGNAYYMPLRRTVHNPRTGILDGVDKFASAGYVETSKADMGMLGFDKIASHLIIFMREASDAERLRVEYEIDDGGWNDFRDVDGNIHYIDSPGRTVLPFAPTVIDGVNASSRGKAFNWIRFRINFERGSSIYLSPVIKAFNLHFMKIPQSSTTFQFTVPLPKEKYRGRGPEAIDESLNALIEAEEMIFLKHHNRLYRGRIAQITGVDATGRDFSGIRNVNFVEIPTNE